MVDEAPTGDRGPATGDRPSAYDQAVKLLSQRTHFRAEIERKLRQRAYSAEEIEIAVARLRDHGYLDDGRAAVEYVRLQRERKGWGTSRLRAELFKRGAGEPEVSAALDELTDADEKELARQEVERWRARGGEDAARLARRLERKGFPARVIVSVLDEAGLDPWR